MADLTEEERQRIYEEEKARHEARKRLEDEDMKSKKHKGRTGCLGFIGLVLVFLLSLSVWPIGIPLFFWWRYSAFKKRMGDIDPTEKERLLKNQRIKYFIVAGVLVLLMLIGSTTNTPKLDSPKTASGNSETSIQPVKTPVEPEYKWEYNSYMDDLSGKNVYQAMVKSNNSHSFGFPYQGDTYGTLILRKHPRYGKDIIFQIDRGQILCHTYSDCTVTIRFDEGKPITLTGNPPEDNSTTSVFLPYSRLFNSIKKSKKIVIGVNVYQEGNPSFTFETKKLDWGS